MVPLKNQTRSLVWDYTRDALDNSVLDLMWDSDWYLSGGLIWNSANNPVWGSIRRTIYELSWDIK